MKPEITPNEKLAEFAKKWVPSFVQEHIIPNAERALANSFFVHLLNEWYENNEKYEDAYKSSILEALNERQELSSDVMREHYKEKALSRNDVLFEFFKNDGYIMEE